MSFNGTTSFDLYWDYLCPYVNAASLWIRDLESELGDQIQINWKAFPLAQVNSREGPQWKVWEPQGGRVHKSAIAYVGAFAAQTQGVEAFRRFHAAMFRTRHEENGEPGRRSTLLAIADREGLDVPSFRAELDNPIHLARIGQDYEEGRNNHKVFGTPTFVFADGAAVYLKIRPDDLPADPVSYLEEFLQFTQGRRNIMELKRP